MTRPPGLSALGRYPGGRFLFPPTYGNTQTPGLLPSPAGRVAPASLPVAARPRGPPRTGGHREASTPPPSRDVRASLRPGAGERRPRGGPGPQAFGPSGPSLRRTIPVPPPQCRVRARYPLCGYCRRRREGPHPVTAGRGAAGRPAWPQRRLRLSGNKPLSVTRTATTVTLRLFGLWQICHSRVTSLSSSALARRVCRPSGSMISATEARRSASPPGWTSRSCRRCSAIPRRPSPATCTPPSCPRSRQPQPRPWRRSCRGVPTLCQPRPERS